MAEIKGSTGGGCVMNYLCPPLFGGGLPGVLLHTLCVHVCADVSFTLGIYYFENVFTLLTV